LSGAPSLHPRYARDAQPLFPVLSSDRSTMPGDSKSETEGMSRAKGILEQFSRRQKQKLPAQKLRL
jgi:hypothetical protein